MHRLIAKNAFYQALAKIVTSGVGFLIAIIIARSFGVTGYGDFAKITTFVALFYLPIDFGLNAVYLQQDEKKENFRSLFYLRILVAFFAFIFCNFIALFLPFNKELGIGFSSAVRLGIFVFSFTLFSQSVILSASAIFQKKLNYQFYMAALVIGAIVNLGLILLSVYLGVSLYFIVLSFVFSSFVTGLMLLFWTKEKILPFSLSKEFSKKIIIKSLPIGLMLLFNLVYFRSDILILSAFKSTKDVGIYGLAYRFFDFLIALPLFLSNSIYPILLENRNNIRKFKNIIRQYLLLFALIGIILILPFWFFSPFFIMIRSDFSQSITPFRILLLSLPLFFTSSFLQWILISLEQQKYLMWIYLGSTVVNILLNLVFIPTGSYIAAATITVISEGIVLIFLGYKVMFIKILPEEEIQNHE